MQTWQKLLLLVVLLLASALAQPPRPSFSVGSLVFSSSSNERIKPLHKPGGSAASAPGSSKHDSSSQAAAAAAAAAAAEPPAQSCAESAGADFSTRLALPQWDPSWSPSTFEDKRQGPYLSLYPRVLPQQIPRGCDPLEWAYQRLVAAVELTIRMGLNYWAPAYQAPQEIRMVCVPLTASAEGQWHRKLSSSSSSSSSSNSGHDRAVSPTTSAGGLVSNSAESSDDGSSDSEAGSSSPQVSDGSSDAAAASCVWMMTSICNSEGLNKVTHPWRGLDCSNFVAWVYNFAFGYYPASVVGEAACHPTHAPGRLLHNITTGDLEQLRPGDLIFGRQSRRHATAPSAVRHVALWTGHTVDFKDRSSPFHNETLLGNVPEVHRPSYVHCMAQQLALGRRVYVVADSNFAGPAYRPFCASYLANFSHARRILADGRAPVWPLSNHPSVARWDPASKTCVSTWALIERQGQQGSVRPHRHGQHVRAQQHALHQHVRHHPSGAGLSQ